MLLSIVRTPSEEEEEQAEGGVVEPKWEVRGAAKGEGTSIDITGSFGNCGFRSVVS
jgi:hypothetical protein